MQFEPELLGLVVQLVGQEDGGSSSRSCLVSSSWLVSQPTQFGDALTNQFGKIGWSSNQPSWLVSNSHA